MVVTEAQNKLQNGIELSQNGKQLEALQEFQKALEMFTEAKEITKTADVLLEMGISYFKLEKYEYAEESYRNALNLYKNTKDHIGEAYSLVGIADVLEKKERHEEARRIYRQAIHKFRKEESYDKEAMVISHLAESFEAQGALQDAIYEHERSIEIYHKAGKKAEEAKITTLKEVLEKKFSKVKPTRIEAISLFIYLALLILSEILTTYSNMKVGLFIHSAILFALLIQSSLTDRYTFAALLRSMMILPMIRIIGLSMPIMQIDPLYWFPIIAIPLFAATAVLMRLQGISRRRIGIIWGKIPVQILIALTGIVLGYIEYQILTPDPLIPTFNLVNLISGFIIITLATGLAEELLFRGIVQKNAEDVLGMFLGLLYTALLFTSLHVGWESSIDLIFVFSVAMFYGYAFQKTRSLLGITLSHGISNTVLFLIMPFVI
ncbi:tetratricopeptide repeat protein [Methanobacterium alcaliphilum]|uniref:tetratricopeptide repeat protein n=1 Tax=Methanobacterium alcaliphilum TaxID=392018 RepID=UPI00200AF5C9|nr:tetratricopeptide repeat protein [Methanobacterium alcaliphilum]MCK9150793.1 tetratricopeptide repeat protein [Methanobacterium alcaliphilum]